MRNLILLFVPLLFLAATCKTSKDESLVNQLLFPAEQDLQLGQQLKAEIEANPSQYPILDERKYAKAYAVLEKMQNEILSSSEIRYKDLFAWELKIIHDDKTLNAFAAPGGYIYIYTGLIKYLDSENELAGVLGHEIAHADRRHSINQLKKQFGTQLLLDIALGEKGQQVSQILGGLIALKFSRQDEKEADEYSVKYLCSTSYKADGASGFFKKIESEGGSSVPEFLSTHPDPGNRVKAIEAKEKEIGCEGTVTTASYQQLINSLP